MSKGVYVGIKNQLGSMEARNIKNIWIKQNGELKERVVAQGLIGGSIKDFILYAFEFELSLADLGMSSIVDIQIVDDKIIVTGFTGSSSYLPQKYRILSADTGELILSVDSQYKTLRTILPWIDGGRLYSLGELNDGLEWGWNWYVHSMDISTGQFKKHYLYQSSSSTYMDWASNLHIAKNGKFILYKIHASGTLQDRNNHYRLVNLDTGQQISANHNNLDWCHRMDVYRDAFLVLTNEGQTTGVSLYKVIYNEESSTFSLAGRWLAADIAYGGVHIEIDGDIAYISTRYMFFKVDLITMTILEELSHSSFRLATMAIDRERKMIFILYSTSSSSTSTIYLHAYNYDWNLVYEQVIEGTSLYPRHIASDSLGLVMNNISGHNVIRRLHDEN